MMQLTAPLWFTDYRKTNSWNSLKWDRKCLCVSRENVSPLWRPRRGVNTVEGKNVPRNSDSWYFTCGYTRKCWYQWVVLIDFETQNANWIHSVFFNRSRFLGGMLCGKPSKEKNRYFTQRQIVFQFYSRKIVLFDLCLNGCMCVNTRVPDLVVRKWNQITTLSSSSAGYTPALQSCEGRNLYDTVHRICEPAPNCKYWRRQRRKWSPVLCLWKEVYCWSKTYWKLHIQVNNHVFIHKLKASD